MSKPKLITRETLAACAAAEWRRTYPGTFWPEKTAIGNKLEALGINPSPDAVDAAIGNDSWTNVPECGGCGDKSPPAVVQVGEELDYESSTANLCAACLADAVRVMSLFESGGAADLHPNEVAAK